MQIDTQKATRREFLKISGKVAGAAILSSFPGTHSQAALDSTAVSTEKDSVQEGRGKYKIFSQGQIASLKVKNRLVRSATMVAAASDGRPTEKYLNLYSELSKGGVALIITGFMISSKSDTPYTGQLFVYDDSYIKGLERIAAAVHTANSDCRLFAQIGHSGDNVSPSGINWPWKKKNRIPSTDEVDQIIEEFADAIKRVKIAGFDGVELHGAHGYLLSSFLSPYTNKRTDKYGGSIEKRIQVIRSIMDKAKALVGPDFPIIIKINSNDKVPQGIRPDTFPALAQEVVNTGVDALDISGNNPIVEGIEQTEDESYFFDGASRLDVNVPIILTGGNRSVSHMEKLLKTNEIDFLGMARPLIREPDLPKRWLLGTADDRATCISCNGCFRAIMYGKTASCVLDI